MERPVAIDTVAEGAAPALFEREFYETILPNIMNLDTEAEGERSLTLKFQFRPSRDRKRITTFVSVRTGLAPPVRIEGTIYIGRDKDDIKAVVNDFRQMDAFDEDSRDEGVVPIDAARAAGGNE